MKKIRVRPGKAQSVLGFGVGVLFCIIGVALVIPVFGLIGVAWTVIALAITVINGVNAFSKKGVVSSEITIEDESKAGDIESRLSLLQELYDKGYLTTEEYNEQREKIISWIYR